MAAPTEYYVDPSIGSDTGDGTIGTPWGRASGSVIQYALDNITIDGTNGDRINIKAGTDDVLSAALSLATYGSPTSEGLILQGYTSVANDGGQGGIDLNGGAYSLVTNTPYIFYVDLKVHNNVSAFLINATTDSQVIRCEVHNGYGGIASQFGQVIGCNVYDLSYRGIQLSASASCIGNYVKNSGTKTMTDGIYCNVFQHIVGNIVSVDSSTIGIRMTLWYSNCSHNSVFSNGGTGTGILAAGNYIQSCQYNLVEGFSGVGGKGIDYSSSTTYRCALFNNAIYNCATNLVDAGFYSYKNDNESLGASPFAKSGSDTFANRATYFAPVDTGNVLTGGIHGGHKGAVGPSGGAALSLARTKRMRVVR